VSHLLDVNFLIACGWQSHADHVRASRWLSRAKSFATSPVSEMGFLRVSLSPAFGARFEDAIAALEAIVRMRGIGLYGTVLARVRYPRSPAARMLRTRTWSVWHSAIA
jgi:predicted nucleic acid-binding protein